MSGTAQVTVPHVAVGGAASASTTPPRYMLGTPAQQITQTPQCTSALAPGAECYTNMLPPPNVFGNATTNATQQRYIMASQLARMLQHNMIHSGYNPYGTWW